MIPGDLLAAAVYGGVSALLIVGLASAASNGLVGALDWIDRRDQRRAARDAATFGEPTRRDVENAYGPLGVYGPSGEAYDWAADLPRRGGVA